MLLIRTATPRDAAALAAIYRPEVLSGTATFELEPPGEAEMAQRIEAITASGHPYLVLAAADGEVVGYAYATAYRARPAYRFAVENSIYVAAGHAGRGHGARLLSALIDAAAAAGFRQMIAVIGDSGVQRASVALHARAGFTAVGRLPAVGFKFGRWLDTLLMQRPLGPGETAPPQA